MSAFQVSDFAINSQMSESLNAASEMGVNVDAVVSMVSSVELDWIREFFSISVLYQVLEIAVV